VARDAAIHGTARNWMKAACSLCWIGRSPAISGAEADEAWNLIGFRMSQEQGGRYQGERVGRQGNLDHSVLVQAILRTVAAGRHERGNIVVWDRNARDLEACGLKISTDRSKVRCFGSDVSGFEASRRRWRGARPIVEDSYPGMRCGD